MGVAMIKFLKFLASKFFTQFKQAMFKQIVGSLETTILAIINDLKSADLSDDDKRKEAFARIKGTLVSSGKQLSDNAIQQAISLAIDILKGK